MSCSPHRQCSVESPRQRRCRKCQRRVGASMPTESPSPQGESPPTPSPLQRCCRNTITEVAARASMPIESRRWSAFHAARTGNVRLRVPASGAAAIGQRRVGVLMPTGESVPFAVRTGLHFMQYNHRGSCMRRPPCRRNTITESRCRQCSVERRVAPCRRNTITEVAARASMPTESRRWSAFHGARSVATL